MRACACFDAEESPSLEAPSASAHLSIASSASYNVNLAESHWRVQRLKTALLLCAGHACPLVVHGPAGSGRTSMAAAVCQFARSWLASPHAVVAARVLASSPAAMSVEYVLSTVCYQIAEVQPQNAPTELTYIVD